MVSSSATQSIVNGDSFLDALQLQTQNLVITTLGAVGANYIGDAAYVGDINTVTQYTLHAGLGCGMGAAMGGNCASGAVSGVVGELTGEALKDYIKSGAITKDTAVQLAGLTGAYSAIATGAATNQSDHITAQSVFAGQNVGSNAAKNNSFSDGIGMTPDENREYDEMKKKNNELIKSGKEKVQNYLTDVYAKTDSDAVRVTAGAGLMASVFLPESMEEIMLGMMLAPVGWMKGGATNLTNKLDFPPNMGFAEGPYPASLIPGAKVDRYGDPSGIFVAPSGTPIANRSLPPSASTKILTEFEVLKPFEVKAGWIAPWYGQSGNGVQFQLPNFTEQLVKDGYLKQIKN